MAKRRLPMTSWALSAAFAGCAGHHDCVVCGPVSSIGLVEAVTRQTTLGGDVGTPVDPPQDRAPRFGSDVVAEACPSPSGAPRRSALVGGAARSPTARAPPSLAERGVARGCRVPPQWDAGRVVGRPHVPHRAPRRAKIPDAGAQTAVTRAKVAASRRWEVPRHRDSRPFTVLARRTLRRTTPHTNIPASNPSGAKHGNDMQTVRKGDFHVRSRRLVSGRSLWITGDG